MAADSRHWFTAPAPIRKLFKLFPLRVYPAEELPHRAPSATREKPSLYVFVAEEDALKGRPSFNPSCLKWQTFLRIAGVEVDLVPSNNHASPSGALPFLLPASTTGSGALRPLTGERIHKYGKEHASNSLPDVSSFRMEAYQALLTQNIRPAWVRSSSKYFTAKC